MTTTSIAAHTGGPWEVREDGNGQFAIAHAKGWVFESDSDDQNRADYRLAAAAPDLLLALKMCAGVCAGETLSKSALTDALEAARAAMVKAGVQS